MEILSQDSCFFCFPVDGIIAFAWEPNGSKFAVLHGEVPRISVSFYHVKNNGKIELISKSRFVLPISLGIAKWAAIHIGSFWSILTWLCIWLLEMYDKQQANTIFWSPQGQFLVLAGLRRCVQDFYFFSLSFVLTLPVQFNLVQLFHWFILDLQ